MKGIKSGYGNNYLPFWAVFNLYVIFICTSIPGLAISPIMGDLTKIFPGTSPLESQMLEIGPNIAAIPFVFLGGWIGTRFNNNKLTTWTCVFYGIFGILFFFVPNMICLIILSFLIGIAAGILSPLASAFIADMFGGKKRTAQYGYTSATLNLVLMLCTIATGYLAKISWRLPFFIYLLPIVPLFFAKGFKKYISDPSKIKKTDADANGGKKVHYKFSQQVNMGMLVRYCIFYFVITFVIASISLYLPFRYTNSATAGDLTSILFFGIMISGYLLNWCLRIMKKGVAIICMIVITGSFILMSITSEVILVGIGIFLATFFYGIAQPYYYERLSTASSRIALTLTLAWFASMDSIGNVVAAPLIDLIVKIFHRSTTTDPDLAFWLCTVLSFLGLVIVIIRKIIVGIRDHEKEEEVKDHLLDPSKPALNPAGHGAAVSHVLATAVASGCSIEEDEPKPYLAATTIKAPKFVPANTQDAAEAAAEAADQVAINLENQAKAAKAKALKAEADAKEAELEAVHAQEAADAAEKVAKAAEEAVNPPVETTPAADNKPTTGAPAEKPAAPAEKPAAPAPAPENNPDKKTPSDNNAEVAD